MPDEGASLDSLHAQLNVERLRAQAFAHLQGALAVSALIWFEAFSGRVPGVFAWLAVLGQGYGLALAVGYGALQELWTRRGARLGAAPVVVVVHTLWTDLEELRVALWSAAGLISLVPWGYVAFERPAPAAVLQPALAGCIAVMLLLAMVSSFMRSLPAGRRSSRRPLGP